MENPDSSAAGRKRSREHWSRERPPSADDHGRKCLHSEAEWNDIKETIRVHYLERDLPLSDLSKMLSKPPHNFNASMKMFKSRFKKWGFEKNITEARAKKMMADLDCPEDTRARIARWSERRKTRPDQAGSSGLQPTPSLTTDASDDGLNAGSVGSGMYADSLRSWQEDSPGRLDESGANLETRPSEDGPTRICPHSVRTGAKFRLEVHDILDPASVDQWNGPGSVYISDSWGSQLHLDLESRQCPLGCNCRLLDASKHAFHAASWQYGMVITILDSGLAEILSALLGMRVEAQFTAVDGFELLGHHARLREHLVSLSYPSDAHPNTDAAATFSKLRLLVEGFLEDHAVWSRYDMSYLWGAGIIDDNLRVKFANDSVAHGISALDDGFHDADAEVDELTTNDGEWVEWSREPSASPFAPASSSGGEAASPGDVLLEQPRRDSAAAIEGDDDENPLLRAIWSEDACAVSELLEQAADVNALIPRPESEITPLMAAVQASSLDIVNLLIDYGADPNLRGNHNQGSHVISFTALHLAVGSGKCALVKALLDRGADVAAPWTAKSESRNEEESSTALVIARNRGFKEVFETILTWNTSFASDRKTINFISDNDASEKASKTRRLFRAAAAGKLDAVIQLSRTGADINAVGFNGTALSQAAQSKKQHVVKALLKGGANPTLTSHYLDRSGHPDIAKSLVRFCYGERVGFQNLRARFIKQYRKLAGIVQARRASLGLAKALQSYRSTWSTGITMIRNICRGRAPSCVLDTVTLLTVARAIAETLAGDKGEIDLVDQFDMDLVRWRQLFPDDGDRRLYSELAHQLWGVTLAEFCPVGKRDDDGILNRLKDLISLLVREAFDNVISLGNPTGSDNSEGVRLEISIARFKQRRRKNPDPALLSIKRRDCRKPRRLVPSHSSNLGHPWLQRIPRGSREDAASVGQGPAPVPPDLLTGPAWHEPPWSAQSYCLTVEMMRAAVEYVMQGAIFALILYFLCWISGKPTPETTTTAKTRRADVSSTQGRLLIFQSLLGFNQDCGSISVKPLHWFKDLHSWEGRWM